MFWGSFSYVSILELFKQALFRVDSVQRPCERGRQQRCDLAKYPVRSPSAEVSTMALSAARRSVGGAQGRRTSTLSWPATSCGSGLRQRGGETRAARARCGARSCRRWQLRSDPVRKRWTEMNCTFCRPGTCRLSALLSILKFSDDAYFFLRSTCREYLRLNNSTFNRQPTIFLYVYFFLQGSCARPG